MPLASFARRLLLILLACAGQARAAAPLPPAESFFDQSQLARPQLSPSGRYLATHTRGPDKRAMLMVMDLDTKAVTRAASYVGADIGRIMWVNDDRLVYDLTDDDQAPGRTRYGPGLFAVNRDGTGDIQLVARGGGATPGHRKMLPPYVALLQQRGPRNSNDIYVVKPIVERGRQPDLKLFRLDTVNGTVRSVEAPAAMQAWMLDAQGEPRVAWTSEADMTVIYYREPANGQWRKLAGYRSYAGGPDAVWPLAFGPDGTLYAAARGGADRSALYTLDLSTGKAKGAPLMVTEGYDIDAEPILDEKRLLGVRYRTDAHATIWFDPGMKAVQQRVDELLPATVNLLILPERGDAPWLLVESYSDTTPATYSVFNRTTGQMTLFGSTHPQIDGKQMAGQQTVSYKARDGLDIQAVLTLPQDGAGDKLPLVVLVHDGPWERGSTWGWRAESQFLASRGYAVLEPAYRGGTGFGAKFFQAGWKQWGQGMQNDLADGVRWAVAQGVADAGRVCIAGRGYGGYATLMGLANDAALYKCGVAWGAVTDLPMLFATGWDAIDNVPDHFKEYGLTERLGDPAKDRQQLAANSPLAQVGRIDAPLLLAYGEVDRKVPVEHGRKFYNAIKRTNSRVEWIEYPDETNVWRLEKTRLDFWRRVESFLDKQIGKSR